MGALDTYQRAIKITSKDAAIWYELGMCQARQKQFHESVASFQKACELRPDDKAYQETMGYAMARAGHWAESLKTLTAIVGDACAHLVLGRMLYHMEKPDQARQYVSAALSRDPNVPGGRDLLVALEAAPPADAATGTANAPTPVTPLPVFQTAPEGVSGTPPVAPTVGPDAPRAFRLPPKPVVSMTVDDH